MEITVRVHPGAREDTVGGRYGDVEPLVLTVRVGAGPGRWTEVLTMPSWRWWPRRPGYDVETW